MSRVSHCPAAGRLVRPVATTATIRGASSLRLRLRVVRYRRLRVEAQQTDLALPPASVTIPKGNWTVRERGVTAPEGFRAAALSAGLRSSGAQPDLSLVVCDVPALAAGVFTQNIVTAAPVVYDKKMLNQRTHVRGVLTNAGQANAATGEEGYRDAEECAAAVSRQLHVQPEEILVMSTGVIGHRICMDRLLTHIPQLTQRLGSSSSIDIDVATAITTTDLAYKSAAIELEIDGKSVTLGGMCKGSGMINPNMATMLGLLTCDAPVETSVWRQMLSHAMDLSFNRITVDGDTSTNDTVLALTSGKAPIPVISDVSSDAGQKLQEALIALSQGLAKSVAWDGEGATCLIEAIVSGAETPDDASTVAKSIVSSMLTKAAIFGHDPNWGRIAAAAGYAGVPFSVEELDITLGETLLMKDGTPLDFDRPKASRYLEDECSKRGTVRIYVNIGRGSGEGVAWGCDLSYDYVKINAEYTT